MNFDSGIPRSGLIKPGETSRLRSPRDSGSQSHLWKATQQAARRCDSQTQSIAQLRKQIASVNRQRPSLSRMYPFKIYNFPRNLRKFKNADDWRRLKVRFGELRFYDLTFGSYSGFPAWGSDCVGSFSNNGDDTETFGLSTFEQKLPSNSDAVQPGLFGFGEGGWNEAIVPLNGDELHFWFSFTDSAIDPANSFQYGIMAGSYPFDSGSTISLATGNTITQTSYDGVSSPYNIRIGMAYIYQKQLNIIQDFLDVPILIRNPYQGADLKFRGAYNDLHKYYVGDVVTIIEDSTSHPGVGLGFLSQYVYSPAPAPDGVFTPTTYDPRTLFGPLVGISPVGHTPDPWVLMSRSPYQNVATFPDWQTGAYNAGKDYLRSQ